MATKKKEVKPQNIRINGEAFETISNYCKENSLVMGSWVAKTCVKAIVKPNKN